MTGTQTQEAASQRSTLAARVVTEVGSPYAINIVTALIAGFAVESPAWGLFVAAISGIIPLVVIMIGMRRGSATDHHVTNLGDRRRVIPVILGIVVVGLVVEIVARAPRELIAWTVAGVAVLVGIALVTVAAHWKISIHTGVYAGTTVLLAILASPWFLIALPLTAMIGWSRVWLGEHTLGQVIAGALLGAPLAAAAYLLLT